MKIKFLILTCDKYFSTRGKSILDTWGKNQNITFLSDKNGTNNVISFDHLSPNYCDMWNRYYEYINQNIIEDDWICFADDDTYINIENLKKTLCQYSANNDLYLGKKLFLSENATDMDGNYTGFPLDSLVGENVFLPLFYASGGAGFIISKNSFYKIKQYFSKCVDIPRCFNTDVSFGMWMKNCGINIKGNELFNSTNPFTLKHCKEKIRESISYHYVDPKTMVDIHSQIYEKI